MLMYKLDGHIITKVDKIEDDWCIYFVYNKWIISSLDPKPIHPQVFGQIKDSVFENIIDWDLWIALNECKKCYGKWYYNRTTPCYCEFYKKKLEIADEFIKKDIPKEEKFLLYIMLELF